MLRIVDSSVVIKWLVPETDSESAIRVYKSGWELLSPEFLMLEVANVLWKKVLRGELTAIHGRLVFCGLADECPLTLESSEHYLQDALDIALQTRRTVYDSLYLAMAISKNSRLITADRKLFNAVSQAGLGDYMTWIGDL